MANPMGGDIGGSWWPDRYPDNPAPVEDPAEMERKRRMEEMAAMQGGQYQPTAPDAGPAEALTTDAGQDLYGGVTEQEPTPYFGVDRGTVPNLAYEPAPPETSMYSDPPFNREMPDIQSAYPEPEPPNLVELVKHLNAGQGVTTDADIALIDAGLEEEASKLKVLGGR